MKTDYTMMCSCGWERYENTLAEAKSMSHQHFKNPALENHSAKHEIYIDRNKDNEIDDSFKSVVITN